MNKEIKEIDKTLKQISDLLYLLRCNMTSITRYVRCEEENPNRESYKKLADTAIDNILNAVNKDLNKDYKKYGEEVARLQKAEESTQEASIEYYNLYKDYKRKYDDLKYRETDLLKEFVEFIKGSWSEEIKIYEELEKDAPFMAREAIKSKLIGMRKMLGLLDNDLEQFLEEKNNE